MRKSVLNFTLNYSQEDTLQLEALEVDPAAAVEMAPLLHNVNYGEGVEGGRGMGRTPGSGEGGSGDGSERTARGGSAANHGSTPLTDGNAAPINGNSGQQDPSQPSSGTLTGSSPDDIEMPVIDRDSLRSGGAGDEGEGRDLQEVIRSLSVYGAVARRRSAVLQEAAQRYRHGVSASHTAGPHDFSSMRFCSSSTGV